MIIFVSMNEKNVFILNFNQKGTMDMLRLYL